MADQSPTAKSGTPWSLALLVAVITAPFIWLKVKYDFRTGLSTATFDPARGWSLIAGLLPVVLGGLALWLALRWLCALPQLRTLFTTCSSRINEHPVLRHAGVVLLCTTILACAFFADNKVLSMGVFVFLYGIQALGLNITVGMTGLLVLGYAGFFSVGAYVFAILAHSQPWFSWWMALPIAAVVAGGVGWLVGLPCLRLRGDYLAIVTLGFAESFRELMRNLPALSGGDKGLVIPAAAKIGAFAGMNRLQACYLATALCLAVLVLVVHRLYHSRIGRAWRAIKADETAAAAMGISVVQMKLMAFTLSAGLAGIAGVLYAGYAGFVDPSTCAFEQSVLVLAMVILGGLGSIPGALLGSAILYLVPTLLRDQFPQVSEYRLLLFGSIMVLMMLFRPQGLLGKTKGGA